METTGDQARALLLAVAVHVALILLVWFGVELSARWPSVALNA